MGETKKNKPCGCTCDSGSQLYYYSGMFNVVALADVAIRVRAQSNETIECALSIRAVCVYVYVMRSLHIE